MNEHLSSYTAKIQSQDSDLGWVDIKVHAWLGVLHWVHIYTNVVTHGSNRGNKVEKDVIHFAWGEEGLLSLTMPLFLHFLTFIFYCTGDQIQGFLASAR